jgi:hypothetical protein
MGSQAAVMATWLEFTEAAPELASRVRGRFEATGLGFLATLRRDGSPRLTGVEPLFALDEVWLGMMPGSRKALDLRRDPRLALHNASTDKEVRDGDARITGRADEIAEGDPVMAGYRAAFEAAAGQAPPPGPFHLFRVDVTEVSFVRPGGDSLIVEWWRPGEPVHRIERR